MMAPFRPKTTWLLFSAMAIISTLLPITTMGAVDESCPNCRTAESLLKPCNSSLKIDTWSSIHIYQPEVDQYKCACNTNFYDQMVMCTTCQTSSSAKLSTKPRPQYEAVCTSFGEQWQEIYMPPKPSTSSQALPSSVPSDGAQSGPGAVHSGLSSGAVAGIVVSAIALVVALSVAGYVYARRKRDLARQQKEDDELYKYSDAQRNSYMEVPLPQYTGMIQPTLPALPRLTNLRVMNPDSDEEDDTHDTKPPHRGSFEVHRNSSPGWRRGSFDDD